jgi:hypothetical protein
MIGHSLTNAKPNSLMQSSNSISAALTKLLEPPRPGLKRPSLFRSEREEDRDHQEDMEARKRMRAEEEDAAGGRGGDEHQHAKRDDGEREEEEEEEEEEGSRMDALPDEMLESVLLATHTRGADSSAAALVPLLFVCRRWNAIVRPHASNGAVAMEWAVGAGRLALVEWLEDKGCPFDDRRLCDIAAAGGHLEVLRWARQRGCPWNRSTCESAARRGHLEALKWMWGQGCDWRTSTCSAAAMGGHLEVLNWAREQGCPWDQWTCAAAAEGGHLEVLRWASEQGCPWNATHCMDAAKGSEVVDYISLTSA